MRKVIKILAMVLSTIVLLSIFLPISITLLLSVDSIQNFVAGKAAEFASDYLSTKVSIGRIDLDLFSRVRVRDFYVEDYEQDTLLYVREARASFRSFDIKRTGLCISDAEATGAEFHLREMADGELNIRPIVKKLTRPDGKSEFKMYIDHIHAFDARFTYERQQHRNPEYGVDYFDMDIRNIDACLKDFAVVHGKVWGDVVELAAEEKSGFVLGDLTGYFFVDKGIIRFDHIVAQTEKSLVYIPSLSLEGGSWECYQHYIDDVCMVGSIERTMLSTDDVGYFAPGLREWHTTIRDVEATFDGVVRDFTGELLNAKIGNRTTVAADVHIIGLPEWQTSKYIVGVERLHADAEDVLTVVEDVTKRKLPPTVEDIVRRAEWADVRATFGGYLDAFRVAGSAKTAQGDLSADVDLRRSAKSRYTISASAVTSQLNVGGLIAKSALGGLDATITANGAIEGGNIVAQVDAAVDRFRLGGYTYSDIDIDGEINGKEYSLVANSGDENLKFDLYGLVNMTDEVKTYDASLMLNRADLHALGINKRDSVSLLSAMVGLHAEGATLDDMSAEISIADAEYLYPEGELASDLLTVEINGGDARNGGDNLKYVGITSEFFNTQFQSRMPYKAMGTYLFNSLKTYVPLLYDSTATTAPVTLSSGAASDYSILQFTAGENINALLAPIVGGVMIAPETTMRMMFNPSNNLISLNAKSEALEYSGVIMANTEIDINNRSDSLSMWVNSSGVYFGSRLVMPNFSITGGAHENRITLTAGFNDRQNRQSGMLGMSAKFSRNAANRRSVHIDITPSHFTTATQQWKLSSKGIDIDSSRISVRDLRIARPEQYLVVDGVASRSRNDSIRLTLSNFDLSPLSAITSRIGYDIEARSNGYATVKSALQGQEIEARIDLDSIRVNNIAAPPQLITSQWDFEQNRARVFIYDRQLGDTVIRGYYRPQGNRYFARANLKRIKVELISPFLKGIISDIDGLADAEARIEGEGRRATLNGYAKLSDIGATVDYTKVRYMAPTGELTIKDNHIYAHSIPVYDRDGNVGHYNMDLNLEHLSNVVYDISIDADKMLVLDTDSKDNDLFYGHVFASGMARIAGDKRGLKMDIEAKSEDNSTFFMPLSGKEDAAYADFVVFKEADVEKPDTSAFLTRRMMAYERKYRAVNTLGSVMDIDMSFDVQPNAEIQLVIDPTVGDIIKGRGHGQLDMHFVPKANILEMRGEYTITEGTYLFTLQNIWNKKFTVEPGSTVTWTGDPMGAMLNINAVYNVKASLKPLLGNSMQGYDMSRAVPVDCYIKLTDELMSPTVTFDVQVPNVAPEIQTVIQSALNDQQAIATQMFWLLAANTFSAEDTGAMGASLSATTGFELLSNQLSNWLSGDDYNIVLRYRPRTELTGDEVDLGFSKSLFDNRLLLEVEGGYLSDASAQATENASNFVGEAFVTYLIDPDGSFRFRGFTQTIDRYGENQGMQETGVGLYYSESFNTFKELGQSLKRRFVSPARQAEREKARAERRERRAAKQAKRSGVPTVNETVDMGGEEIPFVEDADMLD